MISPFLNKKKSIYIYKYLLASLKENYDKLTDPQIIPMRVHISKNFLTNLGYNYSL